MRSVVLSWSRAQALKRIYLPDSIDNEVIFGTPQPSSRVIGLQEKNL